MEGEPLGSPGVLTSVFVQSRQGHRLNVTSIVFYTHVYLCIDKRGGDVDRLLRVYEDISVVFGVVRGAGGDFEHVLLVVFHQWHLREFLVGLFVSIWENNIKDVECSFKKTVQNGMQSLSVRRRFLLIAQ